MADRRIHIPKEHEEFINRLCNANDEEYNGPFKTKADALAFAAAYGASLGKRIELSETVRDPIRKVVFDSAGYSTLINLLAVADTENPNVLAITDEKEDERATIFEEYANGGLTSLSSDLANSSNYTNEIVLIIGRASSNNNVDPMDIRNMFS